MNYPTPSQSLLTKQLNSLFHSHHKWTLSSTSSTCSHSPLMRRVCPRMKKTPGVVGPQMAHRVVSSPEMPPFPFTFDELLRHHRTCVILFLDQISFSLIPASYFHSTSIIVAFRSPRHAARRSTTSFSPSCYYPILTVLPHDLNSSSFIFFSSFSFLYTSFESVLAGWSVFSTV